jgi:hypothetical protein
MCRGACPVRLRWRRDRAGAGRCLRCDLPSNPTVEAGASAILSASARDQQGAPMAATAVVWASGSAQVATINPSSGQVTGVAAGTTTITATIGASRGRRR